MKSTTLLVPLILAMGSLTAPVTSVAADREGVYGFAGLGGSLSDVEYTTATGKREADAWATSVDLGAGYRWSRHGAVELSGHSTLRKADMGELGRVSDRGLRVAVLGIVPLGERFELLGKVSAGAERLRWDAGIAQPNMTRQTQVNLNLGIGARYWISDAAALRLDVDRTGGMTFHKGGNRGELTVASATMGLQYQF